MLGWFGPSVGSADPEVISSGYWFAVHRIHGPYGFFHSIEIDKSGASVGGVSFGHHSDRLNPLESRK